ncbi:ADP-ribosylation factor-like protein 11 [Ruditapes philippinarum]|uniref:ADP-ribosylation factor-like protein 11 n=1 Tax=Ruditapes philippinarum TaxID=129788 RepID=UPI00295BA732|nr:ADP-ribosylation factor-like protein 11 [Ruditapes philippinarum]
MGGVCSARRIPRKVLLTGPRGSGKTTLLYFWCRNMITDTLPTESFNVETVTRPRIGPLLIWDVTDTSRRRQFFHGTEAIVYVFEGGNEAEMNTVKSDLTKLLSDRDLHNLPLLLVVSKQDLNDMSPKKAETILSILNLTDHRHYACVRTRKDDPETYKQAFRHLGEIIHLDSAL